MGLGQQIVQHVARDLGRTAVLYTMEMSARQMMQRVVAAECGIDAKLLRRSAGVLPEADWAAIAQGMDALEAMPLHIVEAGGLTPSRLARSATAFKRAHPDLGVIVIDYIGLMESDGSTMNRQEAIAGISRAIKQLAQRLDVPIVVLSQLNRKSADRADSMPALTDLRDSGAVEQDADVVMLLHRDPQAALGHGVDRHSEMTILVPKCREGDSGAEIVVGVMLAINRMVDYQALPARQLRAVA